MLVSTIHLFSPDFLFFFFLRFIYFMWFFLWACFSHFHMRFVILAYNSPPQSLLGYLDVFFFLLIYLLSSLILSHASFIGIHTPCFTQFFHFYMGVFTWFMSSCPWSLFTWWPHDFIYHRWTKCQHTCNSRACRNAHIVTLLIKWCVQYIGSHVKCMQIYRICRSDPTFKTN